MILLRFFTVLLLSTLAVAKPKQCKNVPDGDEFVENMNPSKVVYEKGELATYRCTKENYHILGATDEVVTDSIRCVGKSGDKEWSGPRPHCVPNSPCSCGSGWIDGPCDSTSCYKFITSAPKSWADAKDSCDVMGGHLLTLESEEETIWIRGYRSYYDVLYNEYFWIGGYEKDGVWYWIGDVEDTPILYTNWGNGQPNNLGGPQDCLGIYGISLPNAWDDGTCSIAASYICEKDQD